MTGTPNTRGSGTALLLFAHGTRDGRGAANAERIAAELRARGRFAEVAVAFGFQAPVPAETLAALRSPRVLVAPLLACAGRMSRVVLPGLLDDARMPGRWSLLAPIGLDPGMVDVAEDLALGVIAAAGVDAAAAAVLVAGHGSLAGVGSQLATERLAAALARRGRFAETAAVYLGQEPRAADWRTVTAARHVVVVPFFVSGGYHQERDLPTMLRDGGGAPDGGETGGRRLWMTDAVGHHPAIPRLIEAQALAALAAAPAAEEVA